jgi:hypothetical protein
MNGRNGMLMTSRVFADDLTGPAWDRVRAIRKKLYGGDG